MEAEEATEVGGRSTEVSTTPLEAAAVSAAASEVANFSAYVDCSMGNKLNKLPSSTYNHVSCLFQPQIRKIRDGGQLRTGKEREWTKSSRQCLELCQPMGEKLKLKQRTYVFFPEKVTIQTVEIRVVQKQKHISLSL